MPHPHADVRTLHHAWHVGQVDILFALFGSDDAGLGYGELLEAMRKREGYRMPPARKDTNGMAALPDLQFLLGCLQQCLSH